MNTMLSEIMIKLGDEKLIAIFKNVTLSLKLFAMTVDAINRQRLYEKLRRFMPDRWAYDLADVWPGRWLGGL